MILVILAAGLLARLGAQDRGGPTHADIMIGRDIPATLYVPDMPDPPDAVDDGHWVPMQQPPGRRPPLIVIAHGHSADRLSMSVMARSLARAGYATLTFDFRGHGANTAHFEGDLRDDLDAVIDWAETSPLVDADRVAVLGHSMGAGVALEFATGDPRPDAVVAVSGGSTVSDQATPGDVLFLVAERDPGPIRRRAENLDRVLRERTASRLIEIGGTDHATILWSGKTMDAITRFLDPIFDVERPDGDRVGRDDPRLLTAALYLVVVLTLVMVLGSVTGRFVPPAPVDGGTSSLALVAGALVLTMPLLATGGPGFLPLGPTGQPVVVHLALAAAVLWTIRLFARRGMLDGWPAAAVAGGPWLPLRTVGAPGLAAVGAMFVLIAPLGVVFHRLVPTPERMVLWILLAITALPFFAAFEALLRQGGTWRAVVLGGAGRLVILGVVAGGITLEVLPAILLQVLPLVALQFAVLELFAATCYARGRNPAVIAVVDSAYLAWFLTMVTPVG